MATIALVFDYDDTLVPDSTTKLLKDHGVDVDHFWKNQVKALVDDGYDSTLAWLRLLIDMVGQDKPLGHLNNEGLAIFGKSLDEHYYPGLPALFDDLRRTVNNFRDISIEFYIVSGGLQRMIEGSTIVQKYIDGVYGCVLGEEGDPPTIKYIKRAVTFTEKTRYLFEISKGLRAADTKRNPYLVNKDVPIKERRIPFCNMIYVGDGLTDIPCFSLLKSHGGTCFGVFNPADKDKAKNAFLNFLKTDRVISAHSAKYGPDDDLGSFIRAAVSTTCSRIVVEGGSPEK